MLSYCYLIGINLSPGNEIDFLDRFFIRGAESISSFAISVSNLRVVQVAMLKGDESDYLNSLGVYSINGIGLS